VAYKPDETEDDVVQIVEPLPLETTKVCLNSCNFDQFPSGTRRRIFNIPPSPMHFCRLTPRSVLEVLETLPRRSCWSSKPVLHHIDLRLLLLSSSFAFACVVFFPHFLVPSLLTGLIR
jgi:hypothetical protein